MSEGIKLKPMSYELFRASAFQAGLESKKRGGNGGVNLGEMVKQLDADEYWDKRPRNIGQKEDHVRRKMQTLRDDEGHRIFYSFKGDRLTSRL